MSRVEVSEVMALERELQSAAVRADPERLTRLLAPDFEEIGASGRVWDLESILAMLAAERGESPEIEVHELTGRALTDDLVILRWTSTRGDRRVRRTSLWRLDPVGWRLVHHQGTPFS